MQEDKTRKIFSLITLIVLLIAFFGIWVCLFIPSDKKLKVTYLNVGQGDSAYIEFPDGKNALVDGGPDKSVLEGLGKNMPFYRRKIDIIYLSHPHADHLAGLIYVLKRYEVGRVVMTKAVHTSPEYQEFLTLIRDKKVPVTEGVRGTEFDFSGGIKAKILYPQSVEGVQNLNDTSEVMLLSFGESKFLFTGDLEKDTMSQCLSMEPTLSADIIKVPHHGSQNALSEDLYHQTKPKFAVISVGKDNKYGHPHQVLVNFLEKAGIKIYRTDKEGNIGFVSDGKSIEKKSGINIF